MADLLGGRSTVPGMSSNGSTQSYPDGSRHLASRRSVYEERLLEAALHGVRLAIGSRLLNYGFRVYDEVQFGDSKTVASSSGLWV